MSAVAMSALTASKSAAIAGGAVRAKRATPAAAPRSLVVRVLFVFFSSFSRPHRDRIGERATSFAIDRVHLGNGSSRASRAMTTATTARTL